MEAIDPEPSRVAEAISRLELAGDSPLSAYWLGLAGDRDAYVARLQPLLRHHGMAVLIVRGNGFDNPNALMVDLVHLLEENRSSFLAALKEPRQNPNRIGIVLLARTELAMGQGYSPVTWPDWVPEVGHRQVTCFIIDVTRRIEVPLDAEEVDVAKLHRALFAVEQALIRRLVGVYRQAPAVQEAFFQEIRRRSDPGWAAFLNGAQAAAANVRTVESYRPDVKKGESVVSRLWELRQERSPRSLAAAGPALGDALGLPEEPPQDDRSDGLISVLARLPGPRGSTTERFCRNAMLTISAACQYITCAAHAGEYQPFPVNLLASVVDDVYHSLMGVETSLNRLADYRMCNDPSIIVEDR